MRLIRMRSLLRTLAAPIIVMASLVIWRSKHGELLSCLPQIPHPRVCHMELPFDLACGKNVEASFFSAGSRPQKKNVLLSKNRSLSSFSSLPRGLVVPHRAVSFAIHISSSH